MMKKVLGVRRVLTVLMVHGVLGVLGGSGVLPRLSATLGAAPGDAAPVAAAAMRKDAEAVRALVKDGKDVNAAQGDGMTALHWAAMNGDPDLTSTLLYAGANVRATTRLGGYTALHLAAQAGEAATIGRLIAGGANAAAVTATGATPLMLAAASGRADAVKLLLEQNADADATESANGETALMFAAALDRVDAIRQLLAHGADPARTSRLVDLTGISAPEEKLQNAIREAQNAKSASVSGAPRPAAAPAALVDRGVAGVTRSFAFNELVGTQGGLTALHFAARQGSARSVAALVEHWANVNAASPGDRVTPLLIAAVNGQYDIATYLLAHGADPSLANAGGVTPLYAVLNIEWAPRMFYPQPRAQLQQKTSYLDLIAALLDKGADPNARLWRKTWFTQYNFDLLRVDDGGATPFWRAAYASDVPAMKLLLKYGADPAITTIKPFSRPRGTDTDRDAPAVDTTGRPLPTGGPGIPPLLAAAGAGYGEGFAANAHRFAPTGMLAAVKFLVEDLHLDVNARDHEGNTALHNAAARGDNEMIEYLVSKGADVKAVNRAGQTTVDMANGPVQRTQPYPDTIKLLEGLGAKNNHKCVSC
ncbi:MAG TPA: ankyrin repeat domain-containing protein [Vicinamibacterales bacterium]|nr:ankyrin repeat domain-containing protein [Vicinamibacterales bacterium]